MRPVRLVAAATLATLLLVPLASAAPATLVGAWQFEEGSGDVILDASGNGHDGHLGLVAGPDAADATRVPGYASLGALGNDGSRMARVPASPDFLPGTVSVAAWVRLPAPHAGSMEVVLYHGNDCEYNGWILWRGMYAGTGFEFHVLVESGVASSAASGDAIRDGNWHHLVGTYDGYTPRLYVDGAEVGPAPAPFAAFTPMVYSGPDPLDIAGTDTCGATEGWGVEGEVDRIGFWSGVLTPEEIELLAGGASWPVPELPSLLLGLAGLGAVGAARVLRRGR